jgi:hypothetical protein
MAHKEESDVKLDLNNAEEESQEESEEEYENMSDEDIIDLDQEAQENAKENDNEEYKGDENHLNVQQTEPDNNQHTINMTTKNNKTAKKNYFTPKNQNMLGKIFMNTTIANTEDNALMNKTEAMAASKTAITMVKIFFI